MVDSKRQLGAQGEELAETYLKSQGYKIIGKNLDCRYGEIDLVVQKRNCLYFVEIRRRIGDEYGSAIESISPQKIHRIKKTAAVLLQQKRDWQDLIPFFSVVAIDEDVNGQAKIEFLPDAFE